MKRKLMTLAIFAIVIAILAGGTLAYFTDREKADNVITTGGVDIELEEKQDPDPDDEYEPGPGEDPTDPDDDDENPDDPDGEWPDWPEEGIEDVTPGQEISKVVYVKNNDSKVWVRIKATVTVTRESYVQQVDDEGNPVVDADGKPVYVQQVDDEGNPVVDDEGNPVYETETVELPLYMDLDNDGTDDHPVVTLPDLDVVPQDADDEWFWTYQDGYFYYNAKVDKNDYTSPLFTVVKFSEKAGNDYQHCTINVYVYAESVQADNNGDTVLEAEGWPGSEDIVGTDFGGDGAPVKPAQ